MANIYSIVARNPDYRINLWLDRPSHFNRTLEKMESSTLASSLHLRDVHELAGEVEATFPRLWVYVMREMSGPYANPAAASDILRLCVLHREGGIYLDTDIQAKDESPHLRLGSEVGRLGQKEAHAGLLIRTQGAPGPGGVFELVPSCNNDLLASPAGSEVLHDALGGILSAYESAPPEVVWAEKRGDRLGRVRHTLAMTGPAGLLRRLVDRLPYEYAFQVRFRSALRYVRAHPELVPQVAGSSAPAAAFELGYEYDFEAPPEHRAAWVLAFEATVQFSQRGLHVRNDRSWLPGRGLPSPRAHEAPK